MKLFRLLFGLCAYLAGVVTALTALLFLIAWIPDAREEWTFVFVFPVAFAIAYGLMRLAGWCFKRRPEQEARSAPKHQPSIPPPMPPMPVPERIAAMGEIGKALFAINNMDTPFRIRDGESEGVDLIAEWNLVDAKWRDMLTVAGTKKVFRIFLKLDPAAREVRSLDYEYDLSWSAGMPVLGKGQVARAAATRSVFRGREYKNEYQAAYRAEDVLESLVGLLRGKWVAPKPIYEYRFNTSEIKAPIIEAVENCGWTFRPVAFGSL